MLKQALALGVDDEIEQYLHVYSAKRQFAQINRIQHRIENLKRIAVGGGNQQRAKLMWCYRVIHNIQRNYTKAFLKMKEGFFYDAWRSLVTVEGLLNSLAHHYCYFEDNNDVYGLIFIQKYTMQFQSLFPYRHFSSIGCLVLERKCTICGAVISIRNSCGHVPGEIYDGELCNRVITEYELAEISIVSEPNDKSCVMFIVNSEDTTDPYNYSHLAYVVKGLRSPFDNWDMSWIELEYPHSVFENFDENDLCPCDSGKKYGDCCLKQSAVKGKHLNVIFSVKPPIEFPDFEFSSRVQGKLSFNLGANRLSRPIMSE